MGRVKLKEWKKGAEVFKKSLLGFCFEVFELFALDLRVSGC